MAINRMAAMRNQEHIIEKTGRGRMHETSIHLIKIIHISYVTKFSCRHTKFITHTIMYQLISYSSLIMCESVQVAILGCQANDGTQRKTVGRVRYFQ